MEEEGNNFVLSSTTSVHCYALVWKKEKLHWNSYTNFMSEVISIDFLHIRHLDVKGTEGMGSERSLILTQTMGRFDTWVSPYTDTLTLAKLKFFVFDDLSTKKVALLLKTRGNIQSMEQKITSAKVKPDRPIQNFD